VKWVGKLVNGAARLVDRPSSFVLDLNSTLIDRPNTVHGSRTKDEDILGGLPPFRLAVVLFWVPPSCPTGRIAGRERFFACLLDLEFGRIVLDWFPVRLTPFFRRFRAHSANSEALHSFASTTFRKSMSLKVAAFLVEPRPKLV
jgi:hypothetical protein